MPSASNYPAALDTDNELYRVTPADVLVPEQLNAKTDAIQNIEAVIGVVSDGSEVGDPDFHTGIAQFVGFPSTAVLNPRYPWLPIPAAAFYGTQGVVAEGWSMGGTVVEEWASPKGYFTLAQPVTQTEYMLMGAVPAYDPLYVAMRLKVVGDPGDIEQFRIGLSQDGDKDNVTGVILTAIADGCYQVVSVSENVGGGVNKDIYGSWCYLYFEYAAGVMSMWAAADLNHLGPALFTVTRTFTPAYFTVRDDYLSTAGFRMWIDYITFGETALPHA